MNKINTKEELLTLLKGYKGILTDSMINYLNSLIELEFSVIRDYICDNDRIVLSELEVYKRIAMYNIYHKALNIFKKNEAELKIFGNNDRIEGLSVYASLGERSVGLFDFNYHDGPIGFKSRIPRGYKTMRIGDISLYQTFESKELREAELYRVMRTLERLYDERNPYSSHLGAVGGSESIWSFDHERKIQEYEERFKQLDGKKELNDEDKREIEITKQFHELLLEDYGLTNKSFEDENSQLFANFGKENTELNKTLVKRMPNLTITDHIKYI